MKLIDTSLPPPIVKIINYMNCNSSVYVTFNNVSGNSWKVENGTRQGGCLSGLLFSFYVNDIIEEASNSSIGCFIDFNCVNIICYADDFILLCPSANGLQFLIKKLVLNLSLNSLKLNANKSKYMIFYCKFFRNYDFKSNIKINGINLELVRQCNYLGTILSDHMCIKHDVERACSKFLKQFYLMYNKFYYLDMRSLTFLFDACCTSF